MPARDTLLGAIGPALAYTQARAASADLRQVDFDVARRLWLERLTGLREDGILSRASATLSEGLAPSIPRIDQWIGDLEELVAQLTENPEALGVNLIDYEEV